MENNYQLSRIQNYIAGLMNEEEMHALEREALDDPLLQDAIDGYKMQNGVNITQLSILQRRLDQRLQHRSLQKDSRFFTWQRLTVGTAAAVMFLVVCSLLLMNHFGHKNYKETEVVLMDMDLRVNLQVNSRFGNGEPSIGWAQLTEEINSAVKAYANPATLSVQFDIKKNKATNIRFADNQQLDIQAVVAQTIEDQVSWKGNRAEIHLKIDKK